MAKYEYIIKKTGSFIITIKNKKNNNKKTPRNISDFVNAIISRKIGRYKKSHSILTVP